MSGRDQAGEAKPESSQPSAAAPPLRTFCAAIPAPAFVALHKLQVLGVTYLFILTPLVKMQTSGHRDAGENFSTAFGSLPEEQTISKSLLQRIQLLFICIQLHGHFPVGETGKLGLSQLLGWPLVEQALILPGFS